MMSPEEMGILFAGISSILATLIYFTKNIKQSSCCGNECRQVVTDNNGNVLSSCSVPNLNEIDLELATFPQNRTAII
jgi:hypothetical protein